MNGWEKIQCLPEKTKKGWGLELTYYNKDICTKKLTVGKGKKCSVHYHKDKKEVFYVLEGKMCFEWIDTENGQMNAKLMIPGDCFVILPNTPHRFIGIDGPCTFIECSTEHREEDSYRVIPGDSQLEKNNG